MDYITLSNGVKMPQLGYGVFQVTQEECERCVLDALKAGYRAIDTAQSYYNEEQVGAAIEKTGVDRAVFGLLRGMAGTGRTIRRRKNSCHWCI